MMSLVAANFSPVSGSVHFGMSTRVSRGMLTTAALLRSAETCISIWTSASGGLSRLALPPPRATLASESTAVRADQQDVQRGLPGRVRLGPLRLGVAAAALALLDVAVQVLVVQVSDAGGAEYQHARGSPPTSAASCACRAAAVFPPDRHRHRCHRRCRRRRSRSPARASRLAAPEPEQAGRLVASPPRAHCSASFPCLPTLAPPSNRPASRPVGREAGLSGQPAHQKHLAQTPLIDRSAQLAHFTLSAVDCPSTVGAFAGAVSETPAPLKSLPRVSVMVGRPWEFVTLLPGFIAEPDSPMMAASRRAWAAWSGAYSSVVFASSAGALPAFSDLVTPSSFCR